MGWRCCTEELSASLIAVAVGTNAGTRCKPKIYREEGRCATAELHITHTKLGCWSYAL
jgi:hypothetical protein